MLTMYDRRNSLSAQVARDVRQHLGEAVYATVIPRNVRVSEAPSFGKPALIYDLKCAGSRAYLDLAAEVLRASARTRSSRPERITEEQMAEGRRGLGRGLSALLDEAEPATTPEARRAARARHFDRSHPAQSGAAAAGLRSGGDG